MKKKMLAMLIAGVMVLGSSVCVMAEETEAVEEAGEVIELTYDMIDDSVYEGVWLAFDGGFDLYLPADWDILEVAEEDAESGVVFQAMAPDESGLNMAVSANEVGTDYTFEALYEELAAAYNAVEAGIINGISCVSFETETTWGAAFIDLDGIMYTVQIGPIAEEFYPYAQNILVSISPTETEAETEVETE